MPIPPRRTLAKLVRFAPDELALITQRANACGRTASRYIRESALGALPKSRHHEERDRLLAGLARIGRDLATMLALLEHANGGGVVQYPIRDDIVALLADHTAAVRALIDRARPPAS